MGSSLRIGKTVGIYVLYLRGITLKGTTLILINKLIVFLKNTKA